MTTYSHAHRIDPAIIKAQIANLRAAHPEIMDDEEERQLALASETDLYEFLEVLVGRILDAEEQFDGISARLHRNQQRKDHFEQRIESLRDLVRKLMEAAGEKKVVLNEATLFVRAGSPKVIITAKTVDELPLDCVRVRKEADKVAIRERLMRGETIDGAVLSNPEPVLNMKVT